MMSLNKGAKLGLIVLGGFIILLIAYIVAANLPISSQQRGHAYYTHAEQHPSYKDKASLLQYCKKEGLNTNYCILVNYSIRSGLPRFFIYDFNKQRIIYRCRCAHGLGGGSTARKAVFSNSYGSRCSSLGKFAISGVGSAHYRNCFRLNGLDKTNNNAARRGVLIHSGKNVSGHKLLPWMFLSKSCEGCLTITKEGLLKLHDMYEKEYNKRILVYAYV